MRSDMAVKSNTHTYTDRNDAPQDDHDIEEAYKAKRGKSLSLI